VWKSLLGWSAGSDSGASCDKSLPLKFISHAGQAPEAAWMSMLPTVQPLACTFHRSWKHVTWPLIHICPLHSRTTSKRISNAGTI
jgi:hypothetical protein